jgi:16S rRNA (uracil1498-N3)-methyltransferase
MAYFNCFVDHVQLSANSVFSLPSDEAQHLKVVRAKKGDSVTLLTGEGIVYLGVLTDISLNAATVFIEEKILHQKKMPEIILIQALPSPKNSDFIIQKATEIGVDAIYPVITERTVCQEIPKNASHKSVRWNAIAIEACKQSGNPYLPKIFPVQRIEILLQESFIQSSNTLRFVASLEPNAKTILAYRHLPSPERIFIAIGPEGGFSPQESALFHQKNFLPLKLATHTLRSETAAVYALSIVNEYFGNLSVP